MKIKALLRVLVNEHFVHVELVACFALGNEEFGALRLALGEGASSTFLCANETTAASNT